jgi:hypothetical protein
MLNFFVCFCQGDRHLCQTFRGMVLRSQLIVLLKNRIFNESNEIWSAKQLSLKMFRDEYPRYLSIEVQVLLILFCVMHIQCIWKVAVYSGTSVHEFNSFLEAVRHPKCS